MIGYAHDLNDEIPGYEQCTTLLRSAETRTTSRSLMLVAVICLVRASLVPWILHYSSLRTLTGPSDLEIVTISIVCMVVMTMLSLWAKFGPLLAAFLAIVCFGGITVYDFMTYPELTDQGLISKSLIWVVLLRAMMNGIMSRTL